MHFYNIAVVLGALVWFFGCVFVAIYQTGSLLTALIKKRKDKKMQTYIEALVKLWNPRSNKGIVTIKNQDFNITKFDLISPTERVQTGQTIRISVKNFRQWIKKHYA